MELKINTTYCDLLDPIPVEAREALEHSILSKMDCSTRSSLGMEQLSTGIIAMRYAASSTLNLTL